MVLELLEKTRSFRRVDQSRALPSEDLRSIVSAIRLCPSAANLQRLRAVIVEGTDEGWVFDTLAFAAYLRPWVRPEEGERPVAYVVLMSEGQADVNLGIDIGVAAEAMLLRARELGIVGCMFRSFDKERLSSILGREGYIPHLVIAFGYPGETVVIEDAGDSIKYYRDEEGVHHVPKLPLDKIII